VFQVGQEDGFQPGDEEERALAVDQLDKLMLKSGFVGPVTVLLLSIG